jgi:hypothetical protein
MVKDQKSGIVHSKKIAYTNAQILELSMSLGGVPYYLDQVKRGDSVAQNIHNSHGYKRGKWLHILPA